MKKMIIDTIGEPAVLEQLAEECAELAHAALKMARVLRGENPTPVTEEKAFNSVFEEAADVRVCLSVLAENYDELWNTDTYEDMKLERWANRITAGRNCGSCKWHEGFNWVCTNGESECRADFTDPYHTCDHWEGAPNGQE